MAKKIKETIYAVCYEANSEEKFKIHPIELKSLSYKHPLVRKSAAIFADQPYAEQFCNFVNKEFKNSIEVQNKKIIEEAAKKEAELQQINQEDNK